MKQVGRGSVSLQDEALEVGDEVGFGDPLEQLLVALLGLSAACWLWIRSSFMACSSLTVVVSSSTASATEGGIGATPCQRRVRASSWEWRR